MIVYSILKRINRPILVKLYKRLIDVVASITRAFNTKIIIYYLKSILLIIIQFLKIKQKVMQIIIGTPRKKQDI